MEQVPDTMQLTSSLRKKPHSQLQGHKPKESWFKYLKHLPQNIKYIFQRPQLGSKQQRGKLLFCLFCVEPYSSSRAGEKWNKCLSCKDWAHEECAPPGKNFLCQNCNSDDEYI